MHRILTLGNKQIDYNRIINATSVELNKPNFGSDVLWGSTLIKYPNGTASSSQKKFVSREEYAEKDYNYGVSFTLHRNSKILCINSLNDYIQYMHKYPYYDNYRNKYNLDFTKISKEYAAFHLTEDGFYSLRLPLARNFSKLNYEDFYWWDAESWIIFNLNAINKGSV